MGGPTQRRRIWWVRGMVKGMMMEKLCSEYYLDQMGEKTKQNRKIFLLHNIHRLLKGRDHPSLFVINDN